MRMVARASLFPASQRSSRRQSGLGDASVGFNSGMALVEPLRGDDLGIHPALPQLAAEPKTKAAGFVKDVNAVSLPQQPVDPGQELIRAEAARRPRGGMIVLGDDDVFALMDVESELDLAAALSGRCGCFWCGCLD